MRYQALTLQLLCCLLLFTKGAYPAVLLESGTTAPDFHLRSQSTSEVSLASYKGRWVILFFFADHASENVALLARNIQRDLAKFSTYDAVVIGIGQTSPESNAAWAKENGITFPVLSDPDQATAKAYGVPVNSAHGKEVYEMIVAPNGKVHLPRITDHDFDGESGHLLACLQVFKEHPGTVESR